jgi:hypothetical protein
MKLILNKSKNMPKYEHIIDEKEDFMTKMKNNEIRQELENNLNHAFRFGSSAFRFGLIPEGVSDHLPIKASLPLKNSDVTMFSWNLLAEEHLFNNFRNISGLSDLQKAFNQKLGTQEHIYNNAMHHLFAELAQFIYDKIPNESNQIIIDAALLHDFVSDSSQPSILARSGTPDSAKENIRKIEIARAKFVELVIWVRMSGTKLRKNKSYSSIIYS